MGRGVEAASTEVWLQAHFREPVNFEALAKWFGMAWRTFHRRFHKAFGGTPKAYLQKLRLAAAQQVLNEAEKDKAADEKGKGGAS